MQNRRIYKTDHSVVKSKKLYSDYSTSTDPCDLKNLIASDSHHPKNIYSGNYQALATNNEAENTIEENSGLNTENIDVPKWISETTFSESVFTTLESKDELANDKLETFYETFF